MNYPSHPARFDIYDNNNHVEVIGSTQSITGARPITLIDDLP